MILRGLKLQMAIQLVAEGILTECEMAARLDISLGTLLKLYSEPVFVGRVRQVRATLAKARQAENQKDRSRSLMRSGESVKQYLNRGKQKVVGG